MNYKLFGPFDVPTEDRLIICKRTDDRLKDFWQEVERHHTGLSQAKGCYVFSISTSGGSRGLPWYVGQTSDMNFERRCLNPGTAQKLYRVVKREYKRSAFKIYFVANMTRGGEKFSFGKVDHKKVERLLIEYAARANPMLINSKVKKFIEKLVIEGVVNSERKLSLSARSFQKLLRID